MMNLQKNVQMACIAAMALTVFSCNNEELMEQPAVKGNTTIVASFGGNSSTTRTSINEKYQILWSEGDKFGMFDNENTLSEFSLESGAGTNTATFRGNIASKKNGICAVFPYQEKESMSISDNTLTMTLPASFEYTQNSNGPMYAEVADPANLNQLSFKHMAALIKLTVNKIPAEATTFKISASNNIAGICTAELREGETPELKVMDDASASKTITVSLSDGAKASRSFFIPLPVGAYESITAELTDGSDKTFFTKTITNVTFKRANILEVPALDCVTITATTPSAINSELENSIPAPTGEETLTTDIALTGEVNATTDNSAIQIPVQKKSNINLAFTTVPKTSQDNPLKLEQKDLGGTATPTTAVNKISVAVPEVPAEGSSTEAPSLVITMPQTTVELGSVGTTASYNKVVATTATNTLIVKAGVTVEELEIAGGNVTIYGTVKKLTISADNKADEIIVESGEAADIQQVVDSNNKFKFSASKWDGVSRTASIPQDGKIYTAAQLASLQGTPNADAVAGKNYPEATTSHDIILCNDIDLDNHPWVGIVLGAGHTFDGNNHAVENITIKQGSYDNVYNGRKDHSSAGFIGAALLNSSVKNLTVRKVTIGDKTTVLKWAGTLVGYSHGAKAYDNCKAENVTFDCNGNGLSFRVGGLIGYIQQNTELQDAVTISKCSVANATLTADFSYGGLLGSLWDSVALTDCSTSGIKLGNSGCGINHGYCSNFIGDAVNAKSPHKRELIISGCTVSDGKVSNGNSELGFGLVPYEQRQVGKYLATNQNTYIGYTDADESFSVTIDGVAQTEDTHYNIYEGTASYWDGKSVKAPAKDKDQPIYTIRTAAELAWVAQQVNAGTDFAGATFNMVNDMDLENHDWTPIGNNNVNTVINVKENVYKPNVQFFKGTFDGGKKTISNLTVHHPTPGSGLFGNVQDATIKNFTVENASINGSGKWTAVVIGYANQGLTVEGVNVNNSSINMTNPDGAVKLAGVVSFASGGFSGDIILRGCTVTDLVINGGYLNFGGLAGYIFQAKSFLVEGCKVKNIAIKVTENSDPGVPNKANYCSAFIGCFNNTNSPKDATTAKFVNNTIEGSYKFDGAEAKLRTFTIEDASNASDENYSDFVCAPWFGDSDATMDITIGLNTYTKKNGKYTPQ